MSQNWIEYSIKTVMYRRKKEQEDEYKMMILEGLFMFSGLDL